MLGNKAQRSKWTRLLGAKSNQIYRLIKIKSHLADKAVKINDKEMDLAARLDDRQTVLRHLHRKAHSRLVKNLKLIEAKLQ